VKQVPKKYQPKGYAILYEDSDLIVGNKAPGVLTVAARWDRVNSVHDVLNSYVRKGNLKSTKSVFVVHRLDQATSGVLIFAKSEKVQNFLKDNWKSTVKTYYTIVHGRLAKKTGTISSYLQEDEDYVVHSSTTNDEGRLSHTEYQVLTETNLFSLLKINLLTGRKNQIRVHLAGEGHPVVGDAKYGHTVGGNKYKDLALHSASIAFNHPHSRERLHFSAPVPDYFRKLIAYDY
jgi:RluA family pseudouridine synthase